MNFIISSTEFSAAGSVLIEADPRRTRVGSVTRRNNRVATLDGGVVVNDFGFSEGDRSVRIAFNPEDYETNIKIAGIVKNSTKINISYEDGIFEAIVRSYVYDPNGSTLSIDILSKLA